MSKIVRFFFFFNIVFDKKGYENDEKFADHCITFNRLAGNINTLNVNGVFTGEGKRLKQFSRRRQINYFKINYFPSVN